MIKNFFKSSFIKNILRLMTGTALAQFITILISPILTRLYTPEDFSVLAIYTAVITILTVISCLRFEIAIPIPNNDKDAFNLVILSLASNCIITLLTWLVILLFSSQIVFVSGGRLDGYLWMFPISVFLAGCYSAFQYWSTRRRYFKKIAKTRIRQSVSCGCAQVGLGILGITPLGLLIGALFQVGMGVLSLGRIFYKDLKENCWKTTIVDLIDTFKFYDKFPKYSTWEALANSAGVQLPIIIIASFSFGNEEAGYLMLAMRLLSAPMSLIGGAVAQVFLSEAPLRFHDGNLRTFTITTISSLAKIGLLPILFVAISAPVLVPFIFGDSWSRTGILISWMAPWYFMQFIVSPVSMTLHIMNAQKQALLLQLFGLIFRVMSIFGGIYYYKNYVAEVYSLSGFVFYTIYLCVVLYTLRSNYKTPDRNIM